MDELSNRGSRAARAKPAPGAIVELGTNFFQRQEVEG